MGLYYEKRNMDNINHLAPNTRIAALKLYEYAKQNNINVLIYETIRTEAQQREYVNTGASQTMKSYHLVGQALDFVLCDSKGNTLWNAYDSSDVKKFVSYAKSLGFTWGGDWKTFIDKPHLQFEYKGYGTDKAVESKPVVKEVETLYPEARDYVVQHGISNGKNPKDYVTREQLWKMLHSLSK